MVARSAGPRKPRAPETLAQDILAWYDANRRELPWRARPGETPDPYAVWLSEIMLQQTTVAAVKGYFSRFLARWPTVEALAAAPIEDVLAAWAGLGYYARARNLHACARAVAGGRGGRFPADEAALRRLPGVGPYTAAAIAAIAFDQPSAAIDGNVERVISRLCALPAPPRAMKREIRVRAEELTPPTRAGDFAQAMMDLGATVCLPRAPHCGRCPLEAACAARRLNAAEAFPVMAAKPEKPRRRGAAFILRSGRRVLLTRRPAKGLLGGMTAFPATPLTQDVPAHAALAYAPVAADWRALDGTVSHVFTHFALELTVFAARIAGPAPDLTDCRWPLASKLDMEGLPTVMRKAAAHAGLIERGSAREAVHGATKTGDRG
jgi:A/G-specific adenine glycosylase